MADEPISHRLGRLDTCFVQFGPYSFLVRPDRSGDEPAVFLLQVTGPGLPDLHVTEDGVRPLPEGDAGHGEDGCGVIVFGGYGGVRPRITFPGRRRPLPDPGDGVGSADAKAAQAAYEAEEAAATLRELQKPGMVRCGNTKCGKAIPVEAKRCPHCKGPGPSY